MSMSTKNSWGMVLHGYVWALSLDQAIGRYEMNFQNGFAYFVGPARAHAGQHGSGSGPHVPIWVDVGPYRPTWDRVVLIWVHVS